MYDREMGNVEKCAPSVLLGLKTPGHKYTLHIDVDIINKISPSFQVDCQVVLSPWLSKNVGQLHDGQPQPSLSPPNSKSAHCIALSNALFELKKIIKGKRTNGFAYC